MDNFKPRSMKKRKKKDQKKFADQIGFDLDLLVNFHFTDNTEKTISNKNHIPNNSKVNKKSFMNGRELYICRISSKERIHMAISNISQILTK